MTLTVPALPNIIRLRSPPISERATDGSSDKEGKAEFLPAPMPPVVPFGSWNYPDAAKSFTAVEISRREETRKGPAPAAPLTTQNLTQYQEEIGSAREQPPHEIATGFEVSMSATSQMGGSSKQADSFEWTKKFVDFQRRQRGRAGKEPEEDRKLLLRQLTEPLNSGKGLPSPTQAIELINDQIMKENTISKRNDEIEYDRLWALTQDLPAASQERKYFSMDRWSGQPGLSSADLPVERQHFEIPYSQMGKQIGTPSCRLPPDELGFREYPEDMGVTSPKLEKGNLPSEIMNFNRETDVHTLDMILDPGTMDLSDDNQSPFIFGETPLLQAVMSDQIENDLAAGSLHFGVSGAPES